MSHLSQGEPLLMLLPRGAGPVQGEEALTWKATPSPAFLYPLPLIPLSFSHTGPDRLHFLSLGITRTFHMPSAYDKSGSLCTPMPPGGASPSPTLLGVPEGPYGGPLIGQPLYTAPPLLPHYP